MKLLAIDPGDRNLGYAYHLGTLQVFGTFVNKKDTNQWERIEAIRQHIDTLEPPSGWLGTTVVIEEGYRRAALVRLIGYLAGYLTAQGCTVITPHPAQWPRTLFGVCKDYKQAAKRWCRAHKYRPETQHEADALCLLGWYRQQHRPRRSHGKTHA